MIDYALIVIGLVMLIGGAEYLIQAATKVAEKFGVSPFLIGLTLVAFGTSLPELVASIQAALIDAPALAIGNIVGSNIANTLLVLGCAAVVAPIALSAQILKRDGTVVLACSILFLAVALLTDLDAKVGAVFLVFLVLYLIFSHKQDATNFTHVSAPEVDPTAATSAQAHTGTASEGSLFWPALKLIFGLIVVVVGGRILVESASNVARLWGVSDAVVGLTILAIGTSLPELFATMVASYRNQSDMALGNILGSNVYNILCIGGVTGIMAPSAVPAEITDFDIYVMLGSVVALLVCALLFSKLNRIVGLLFVAAYAGFIYML